MYLSSVFTFLRHFSTLSLKPFLSIVLMTSLAACVEVHDPSSFINDTATSNKLYQTPLVYSGKEGSISLPSAPISFTLTGGSGTGTLSISSENTNVAKATLNSDETGGTITLVGEGVTYIVITKAGDDVYQETSEFIWFDVSKLQQEDLVYTGLKGFINLPAAPISFTLSGGSGTGDVSVSSDDENVVTVMLNSDKTGGTITPVGGGDTYVNITKAGDDTYQETTTKYWFSLHKAYQQSLVYKGITGDIKLFSEPISFTLTGGSGTGAVSISSGDENVITATLNSDGTGGTITPVGEGHAQITITKAWDANYNAQTTYAAFHVSKPSQAALVYTGKEGAVNLSSEPISFTLTGGSGTGAVSISSSDNNVVTVTLNSDKTGGTITPVGEGYAEITITKAGDYKYQSTSDSVIFYVRKESQEALVYTGAQGSVNLSSEPISFTLTGGSGTGAVSISSSNNNVIAITLNSDKTGGTITPVGEGYAYIVITKAGDDDYQSTSTSTSFSVRKTSQTALVYTGKQGNISLPSDPISFTLTGGNGTGAVSISSSNNNVVTTTLNNDGTGGTITPVGAGYASVIITKAGDANYQSTVINRWFDVSKSNQEPLVYTGTQGNVSLSSTPISFTLTGGSGTGAVRVISSDSNVLTTTLNNGATGGTVTLVGEGNATLTISKAGDNNYLVADVINIPFFMQHAPSNLIVGASDEQVSLSWVSTSTKFLIHSATESLLTVPDPANYGALPGYTSQEVTSATQATITGLTNGTQYYFLVTALSADDTQSSPSNQVSATPMPLIVAGTGKVNDSGFTDISYLSSAPQDGSQGRDALAKNDALTKTGAGLAGFDFTKIGANGTALTVQNAAWTLGNAGFGANTVVTDTGNETEGTLWSCVLDNHTGLMWEAKTNSGLHNKADGYTWYNTDSTNNAGELGTETSVNIPDTCDGYLAGTASTYCNTQAFVAKVNDQGLCGANDWRMPDLDELRSIVDYSTSDSASIDAGYFPNTDTRFFWSSSPSANNSYRAWGVNFGSAAIGQSVSNSRFGISNVRLVRAAQ